APSTAISKPTCATGSNSAHRSGAHCRRAICKPDGRISPGDSIMHGKVLVVTGALGALGKVVAETALSRGARVAGIDYAPSQAPATAERIEVGGVDLSDAAQAKAAIDVAAKHFGQLDALINIAGGFAFETVGDGNIKTWQRMYALNVLTALNASRAALAHLAAS